MKEVLLETLLDTVKTVPFLFIVYLAIELLQSKFSPHKIMGERLDRFGPIIGAGVGSLPQCGFSAASAALYQERIIGGGTLIAVFLATSDEAIPVLLSHLNSAPLVINLVLTKLVIAIIAGYLLKFTLFRGEVLAKQQEMEVEYTGCECDDHHEHHGSVLMHALHHTVKISLFILVTLAIINVLIFYLGEENLGVLLLSGSPLQPFVTGLVGLVPGCTTSVLLTELMVSGSITFGSAIAGLSSGAGFGYIVLFRGAKNKLQCVKIVAVTYVISVIAGLIVNLLF